MNFFSKEELKILAVVFGVLIFISVPNFIASFKKSRDVTRKNDLFGLSIALNEYKEEFESYPASLSDLKDILQNVPQDPQVKYGLKYYYVTTGNHFQLLASLEDKTQDEYDPTVEKRNISCGTRTCNFGRSDSRTPLDKSLEEYENELNEKK